MPASRPASRASGQALPDPALFPEAAFRASLQRVARRDPALLGEYPVRMGGSLALREQIARHYAHVGMVLPAEDLLITNGCIEALTLAMRVVTSPGDTIVVESPSYFGMLQIAESLGVKVIEIPSHPRDGLQIDALRELLSGKAGREVRAIAVTVNFSNPNGSCMPLARKRELVKLCGEFDLALIEDDVYGDLQFEGARPLPCKAFDRDGRVLLCSSFSKSLAPGARLGYIVPGRYRDTLRAAKHMISGATPLLQQEMLADFLQGGRYERHLRRMRRALSQQVMRLSQCVQDAFPEGTRLTQPEGGFVLWVELPSGIDTLALHEEAVRLGLDYVPGALFSASGRYANCLRLNAGYAVTPATEMAIRRLGQLFAVAPRARRATSPRPGACRNACARTRSSRRRHPRAARRRWSGRPAVGDASLTSRIDRGQPAGGSGSSCAGYPQSPTWAASSSAWNSFCSAVSSSSIEPFITSASL